MPLKKLALKAGVNRENTRYTAENGWYESEKVRFRQGTPEKIGGWTRLSANFFLGVCRSMWNWVTLGGSNLLGVGTNLKFYIEQGGAYNDITPLRSTSVINTDPFTGNGTTLVTVTDTAHGGITGDFVTFSGATGAYAATFNAEFQITVLTVDTYTIITPIVIAAGSSGGASVTAAYQINTGAADASPVLGWGAGGWGTGPWGTGTTSTTAIRLWQQKNFGENLVFGYRGGPLYYWDNTTGLGARGVLISGLGGAVTFTNASPTVVTATLAFTAGTPIQFAASVSLPTGVSASTTYYVTNVTGLSFNIADSSGTLINTSSTGSGAYISLLVDVPLVQNYLLVSDTSRFVFCFGANDYGSSTQNQMLIRWSAQESITD
jgi:hypothetical protein